MGHGAREIRRAAACGGWRWRWRWRRGRRWSRRRSSCEPSGCRQQGRHGEGPDHDVLRSAQRLSDDAVHRRACCPAEGDHRAERVPGKGHGAQPGAGEKWRDTDGATPGEVGEMIGLRGVQFRPGNHSMILVPATVHGRVLIEPDGGAAVSLRALVGFHGYAQTAGDIMQELNRIPGATDWTRVSIQALNRFYLRGDAQVVANWMTREDRDQAIADNIAYVDAAIAHAGDRMEPRGFSPGVATLVFVGFSQGAAMAYRTALSGARPAA